LRPRRHQQKKSAYSLRHGFCVQAIKSGDVTDREIAVAMGHSGTDLIHWYGREAGLDSGHLRSVVRRVHAKKAKPTGELPLFSH
jgi:site-specific recombinase XerD